MNNIFDSHAHYDDSKFDSCREEIFEKIFSNGVVGVINCGCDLKSSLKALNFSVKYPQVYAAVGIHPHEAEDAGKNDILLLSDMLSDPKCVAVGEIGLDYHYDFSPRDIQRDVFEKQLQLAKEKDMPVIIHDREAHEDTLELLKKYRPKGVVHCFSGSAEMAKEVVKLGMYIGLGGAVTFKNAKKPVSVAAIVPDDRLLIETDCPYMAPIPFRGKINDSSLIPYTAQVIASVRGTTAQEILDLTCKNAKELFNI